MSALPELPPLLAPVSVALPVADPRVTLAFYRDLLGFEARARQGDAPADAVVELVRGPARIMVRVASSPEPRVLFFEAADLRALREAVLARGAAPASWTRVNGIKYEIFQLADPDGHVLWFGESYDRVFPPRPEGQLRQALPELPCAQVAAAVAHYCDLLGFHINYQQDDLGVMYRDDVTVLLVPAGDTRRGGAEFYVQDADALHAELSARGAHVQDQPVSHPWGLRDFHVLDLDGNRLTFAQPFE